MNLMEETISRKQTGRRSADAFWEWFADNERRFREAQGDASKVGAFLDELMARLQLFNRWLKVLIGPYARGHWELIITADADIALFSRVEELVSAAPVLKGWIFTALKPGFGLDQIRIDMYDREFSARTMQFYPEINPAYPDKIKIVLVHKEYDPAKADEFRMGSFILVENGIGELAAATRIDEYHVRSFPAESEGIGLIPLDKLDKYLAWREKEFIEKYEHAGNVRPKGQWGVLEGKTLDGHLIFAAVNRAYKNWEFKPAYPWLGMVEIRYKGDKRGLPSEAQFREMDQMEKEIVSMLPPEKVIHTGHTTINHCRTVYLFTSDYKAIANPIMDYVEEKGKAPFKMDFFIRKDKYWEGLGDFA